MRLKKIGLPLLVGASFWLAASTSALAEIKTVNIAQQYGISYLPLMVMQDKGLLKIEAKAAGLGDIKVNWAKFAGGNVMNDAILSGDLQFASGGVGPFVTLWAKTRSNVVVKGVTAMNSMPLLLTTRNPAVKTIKDFTSKDRIALPAVKVSIQAITLQMAAEKAFGPGQQNKLDAITVTQSHPDGMAALLSGSSEINSHFTSPPFQYIELSKPGIHTVLNSYDVTGGPHTFNVVWATQKFADANPKTYAAFVKAFDKAVAFVNNDKQAAAELYIRVTKSKEPASFFVKILNDPNVKFTTTPQNVMKYVDFMYRIGFIKAKPASWKDMFFPNMHNLPGS
ncbi:ABC transporter substrate-binding protein [Paralcaligenes ureilyticus]|uniref:NitT/TauT family transport system substrate-binding protein n=1 Tax=Paralcaligenes ureilyticus TaxID=627131 RepID=A0A4R3MBY7_9BURK|nr:ABC transporter substrate-binding protein [Paralcaligenes ureilyticus]TCT08975.1 NitT/TauT family transport system substrate-binding protein [Paralcaligenes ureilyticus]